ncbi:hypothetical protein V1477_013186 [Vespula maculifrons]|uniref:Uncharacterized protein n=1 Tax=Vespula maculifrons TaxID=7453 RepID=A0ABD2BV74_VESMC
MESNGMEWNGMEWNGMEEGRTGCVRKNEGCNREIEPSRENNDFSFVTAFVKPRRDERRGEERKEEEEEEEEEKPVSPPKALPLDERVVKF